MQIFQEFHLGARESIILFIFPPSPHICLTLLASWGPLLTWCTSFPFSSYYPRYNHYLLEQYLRTQQLLIRDREQLTWHKGGQSESGKVKACVVWGPVCCDQLLCECECECETDQKEEPHLSPSVRGGGPSEVARD